MPQSGPSAEAASATQSPRAEVKALQRPGGRTEQVRQRVIGATIAIIAEEGARGVTVEAVALRSGVARTTLYRRWESPERLILEALRQELGPRVSPVADTGSFRGDLKSLLSDLRSFLASEQGRGIMEAVFFIRGSADTADAIHAYWSQRFEAAGEVVRRAATRGELDNADSAREIIEFAAGPVYFTVFVARETVTDAYIDHIVDFIVAGCGAKDPGPHPPKRKRS